MTEALDVSRQTISNWENGKTYPDIVSVVKMSELYAVSLDRLIKGEAPVSDYLDYLEESTNVVKSKNKLSRLILIATYLVIWALSLIVFWFFTSGFDAMGYSVMFLWILLPVTTFVLPLLIGKNGYTGESGSGSPRPSLAFCTCWQNTQPSVPPTWLPLTRSTPPGLVWP